MKAISSLKEQDGLRKKTIARRLNEIYHERWKGTQSDFAEKLDDVKREKGYKVSKEGCQAQYVSDWINGKKTPSDINLECISEILDVDLGYFTLPYSEDQASDIEYIRKQDRQFRKEFESLGIRPEFIDLIMNEELFSLKFPFNPLSKRKLVKKEESPQMKRFARVNENGALWDIDMTSELSFISELQNEVRKTIDRVYWDRFEDLRLVNVELYGEILSKIWRVDQETVIQLYKENPDWFLRTRISLKEQVEEDRKALGDLMWNYAIDHKIERIFDPFLPDYTYINPEIAELNRLRHEDLDELERKAREQEEEMTRKANEQYEDVVRWINEGIQNGTLKKKERRK